MIERHARATLVDMGASPAEIERHIAVARAYEEAYREAVVRHFDAFQQARFLQDIEGLSRQRDRSSQ